jgi:HK97 family phage prohead protease
MTDLNLVGESYAHSLIAAAKVDRTSAWSFDAADGNALLGKNGDDWENCSRYHLGLDRSANDRTKARYKFPFAKANRLYRSGLIAAKQRAAQQGDSAIEKVAGELIDLIDKPKSLAARPERKAFVFEYKFVEEGTAPGTFEGYGSVFNNEDDGGDLILPGAFAGAIQRHQAKSTMPKMLLNHGSMGGFFGGSDPMADLPVGCWNTMSEDTHGLQCKGRLINLDTESGKRIYGAMKERALDGLSIGYTVGEFTRGTKPNEPRRTIKTIKSLPEVSLVTFPMNELARTGAVKAADIRTVRQFEDALRDVLGFSHAAAKSIAQRGFKAADAGSSRLDRFVASLRDVRRQI